MNCRRCQEYLEEFGLQEESLMAPEVRQHLEHCAACRGELENVREAWSLLAIALDPPEVPHDTASRLMGQVEPSSMVKSGSRRHFAGLFKYGLAASILIIATSSLMFWSRRQATETRYAQRQAEQLQKQLDQFNDWKRGFGHPTLHFVSLDGSATSPTRGYLVHDLLGKEGHFFAFDTAPPPADHIYKVWVLTNDGQVCASAVLPVGDGGMAGTTLEMPGSAAEIGRVIVTIEHDPHAAIPSKDVRLQAVVP